MVAIYVAGIVSGVLLVAIGLAGWVRNAGKKLGGDTNQTSQGSVGAHGTAYPISAPMARHGAHSARGRGRDFARAA